MQEKAIKNTQFQFSGLKDIYHGKVRDVYFFKDKLAVVATDRISAFDHILPEAIPYKGQVLNQIAAYFLEATKSIVPNWVEEVPHANVTIGKNCQPIRLEMVIRGYLTGHAWRTYKNGERELCGNIMPEGMKENQQFETPIITPTTKADIGHDEEISKEEIIQKNIVSKEDYEQLEKYTHQIFQRGTEIAAKRGLILVDTKYEFGKIGETIYLIDEIHTPDSSRYFYTEGYEEKLKNNEPQKQLSKEFVREWLIANNFMGKEGQTVPKMTDEIVENISNRYIELYELILGEKFIKKELDNLEQVIINALTILEKTA